MFMFNHNTYYLDVYNWVYVLKLNYCLLLVKIIILFTLLKLLVT